MKQQTTAELIADLDAILNESTAPVVEAKGGDLERKARNKRKKKKKSKTKHLGSGRNPFKRKDHLGVGPRGRTNTKTGAWKCSCKKPYQCSCKNGKRTKLIRISKSYKKSYNSEYKAHTKATRPTQKTA